HGPIVAVNNKGTKALALRVAGLDQPSMVTQYWRMIQANNLQEFIQANSALQMPFFNVIYAGQDGNIFYLFGGRQPIRQPVPSGSSSWGDYSGVLDGSIPSLLWTNTFDFAGLPQAINPPGGFVANSNNPPWTSAFSTFSPFPLPTPTNDPAHFPAYVSPQFMDLRAQNGALLLQSKTTLSVADVLAAKRSTHMLLADPVLRDLINAAMAYPDPTGTAKAAATELAGWDGNTDFASPPEVKNGAVLFEAWWNIVFNSLNNDLALPRDKTINFYSPHPPFGLN